MKPKIVIIGYSGSGKSTLAQQLGKHHKCEVMHLDCIHWLPGWNERDKSEVIQIVSEFLDFPVHICLYRVLKRYFSNRGKSRESMTEGCDEKIDWEFFWWIIHEGRKKSKKEWYKKIYEENRNKTFILKNPRMVQKFINI